MSLRTLGVAIFAAALAAGCKNADDDVEPAFVPKTIAFEGKVESKYVGDWSAKGASRLNLKSDGTAVIESTTNSQSGKSTARFDGKWLAQDGRLLVQYGDATHPATTLEYEAKLSGDNMVLQQPGGRLKTTYARK